MAKAKVLQPDHFEYRYLIEEDTAVRLKDFVGEYLELDPHSVGRPSFSYPVQDIYLDTSQWRLYWGLVNAGAKTPLLRVRFYDENPQKPAYLESKRRHNHLVQKQRSALPRSALPLVLAGHLPDSTETPTDTSAFGALQRFTEWVAEFQPKPRVRVGFVREAWVKRDDTRIRLTIDRQVKCELLGQEPFPGPFTKPRVAYGKQAVLELKFVERFPKWFEQLIDKYRCRSSGTVKYVDAVRLVSGEALTGSDTTFF